MIIRRVDLALDTSEGPVPVGTLSTSGSGDLTRSSFMYDPEFMYGGSGFDLAPRVRLEAGEHSSRGLPLFVEDAGPDSWGSFLLRRRAAAESPARYPDRLDCVLGASDYARQGALRFRSTAGEWLAAGGVPKQMDLAKLLGAADEAASSESLEAIAALLDTGTSALGGARPKAAVTAAGQLWMAKFPKSDDRHDVALWEEATLAAARRIGIDVPESQLVQVRGRNVLLLRRFDRVDGRRVPYQSFRTLMDSRDERAGAIDYLDIVPVLRRATQADARAFFRRVAFSVVVNNTDDHLRNMGLLRVDGQWELSPAFDVNPEPDAGKDRHTPLGGASQAGRAAAGFGLLAGAVGLTTAGLADELDLLRGVVPFLLEEAGRLGAVPAELARFDEALGSVQAAVFAAATGARQAAGQSRGGPPRRAKTSEASNRGSFAPRRSAEADGTILD